MVLSREQVCIMLSLEPLCVLIPCENAVYTGMEPSCFLCCVAGPAGRNSSQKFTRTQGIEHTGWLKEQESLWKTLKHLFPKWELVLDTISGIKQCTNLELRSFNAIDEYMPQVLQEVLRFVLLSQKGPAQTVPDLHCQPLSLSQENMETFTKTSS